MKNPALILMTAALVPAFAACRGNERTSGGRGNFGSTGGNATTHYGSAQVSGSAGGGGANRTGSGVLSEVDTARADATASLTGSGSSGANGVVALESQNDGIRIDARVVNAPAGTYNVMVAGVSACPWSKRQGTGSSGGVGSTGTGTAEGASEGTGSMGSGGGSGYSGTGGGSSGLGEESDTRRSANTASSGSNSSAATNGVSVGQMTIASDGIGRFDKTVPASQLGISTVSDLGRRMIVLSQTGGAITTPLACGTIMTAKGAGSGS